MPVHFPFDPNIATASTIPSRLYTDPVYLELEKERVFARSWQLVGRTEQVRESGQFFTAEVAGESVVVLRDGAALRSFHNVCLHRAGPVAYGCGRRQTLQCRYHGWTYNLRGELLRAPEMEGVERFSPADMHLLPVQVDAWGPLVFVNLDLKAPPLSDFLADIPARAESFHAERMSYVMRRDYEVACNWKVYVDNYLEGYHVPVVHPGLHKELDYDEYRVEPHRYYSVQHAPLRPVGGEGAREGRQYVPDPARGSDGMRAQYYWLFPNIMLNVYLGQMQTNVILPLGHDRTLTIFEWYSLEPVPAADAGWTKLLAFSDEIQVEDIEICEAVQKNLRSRVYERGRYSAKRENGVHHFHSLLHEFLT
ncbi:MAG: aromatic ring-hydroxylating oxygenase subunit alpha [Gemmatimonadaceae bacterium]